MMNLSVARERESVVEWQSERARECGRVAEQESERVW